MAVQPTLLSVAASSGMLGCGCKEGCLEVRAPCAPIKHTILKYASWRTIPGRRFDQRRSWRYLTATGTNKKNVG
eukprot:1156048-Pelagomonas_calceolata.AAC.11